MNLHKASSSGLNKQIIRLAIPAIVSNITVPLLGLCDTGIAGHLGSRAYLGAIAVGTIAINAIFWCMGFLRMGTTGLTAQALGAGDKATTKLLFTRALLLGLMLGILVFICHSPLRSLILSIIGADSEVSSYAEEYFNIVILGAPAMLATMAVSGWFLGMQTSVQPMIIAVTTNIINIGASLLCVFSFDLGFAGTAVGTLIANWTGLLISFCLAHRFNDGRLPLSPLKHALRGGGWTRFFNVNIYIFLRSFCIMAVSMGVPALGARLGTDTLAVNAVIMQFFVLYSYFMDGFAFAGEALTGKAIGKGERRTLNLTVSRLLMWGASVMLLFLLCYRAAYSEIAALITDNAATLQLIEFYRIWIFIIPLSGLAFIFDGIFIGLTATGKMLLSALGGLVGFYAIAALSPLSANNNIWLAFITYLLLRGLILTMLYRNASNRALLKSV